MAAAFATSAGIPAAHVDGLLGHAAGTTLSKVLNPLEQRQYPSLKAYLASYRTNKIVDMNINFWYINQSSLVP